MRGNGRQICRHCGELQQGSTDPLLLDCYPKINTVFFFGTSEKQMVNVNASCLPETAGLRLNLLSFFFFMLISFLLDIDTGTFLK